MDVVNTYATTRRSLLSVAVGLDAADAARAVPALPGWSVKDAVAHVTGVCTDILAGDMEGAGGPAWTARQVRERQSATLQDVCEEWSSKSRSMDAWLRGVGEGALFCCFDVWNHEQDVRGALGLRGEREDARVRYLAGSATGVFSARMLAAGAPPVRVITEGQDALLAGGDAVITLRTTDYELLRLYFGRRSRSQVLEMGWEGNPNPAIEHLHLFPLPETDLAD